MSARIQPFTELSAAAASVVATSSRFTRSHSVCSDSSFSTTSSLSSKKAEEMLDRLIAQAPTSTIHLWSAGNVRLGRMDLTIASHDAMDLIEALKVDERFRFISLTEFDDGGDDWKVTFERTHSFSSSPATSDSE